MGTDFITLRAKPFTKGWDKGRLELANKNLFTREPDNLAVGAVARLLGPTRLSVGDEVLVRVDGERLVVIADLATRAVFVKPTENLVGLVRESGGYANGTITAAPSEHDFVEVLIK